jgi:DNA-binding response OmpR family regulator
MKILSVGNDRILLKARHQLLLSQGYEAEYALPEQAVEKLRAKHFSLVILSATLLHEETERIRAAATNGTKLLDLTTIVRPAELLEMIKSVTTS